METGTQTRPGEAKPPGPSRADYLGPARVTGVGGAGVRIRLEGGTQTIAQMALAYPYRPVKDDVVLTIGKDDAFYVIGVIQGQGHTQLEIQGDVEMRAVGGRMVLAGDEGVELRGRVVEIYGDKLKMMADSVTQRFSTMYQRVHELLTVQAGESRKMVRGNWYAQADRAQLHTKDTIAINGKQIHLG